MIHESKLRGAEVVEKLQTPQGLAHPCLSSPRNRGSGLASRVAWGLGKLGEEPGPCLSPSDYAFLAHLTSCSYGKSAARACSQVLGVSRQQQLEGKVLPGLPPPWIASESHYWISSSLSLCWPGFTTHSLYSHP